MPSLVTDLSPQQLQWIYENQRFHFHSQQAIVEAPYPTYRMWRGDASKIFRKPLRFPHGGVRLTWEQSYENLKKYNEHFGDCNVPRDYAAFPALGSWVHRQRVRYRNPEKYGSLNKVQIEMLEKLGFQWMVRRSNGDSIGPNDGGAARTVSEVTHDTHPA